MHEEIRIKNTSLHDNKSNITIKKDNAGFFPQECNCYKSESCYLLASPPSISFASMASFAISSSSSTSLLPVGNNSPQPYEQRFTLGSGEYLKKSCCIPSTSLSSSSCSMNNEGCKFNLGSGVSNSKCNNIQKQTNGTLSSLINSNWSNISEKANNTNFKADNGKIKINNSNSNVNGFHSNNHTNIGSCFQKRESNKYTKSNTSATININNKHTTYECENTQTGGSAGAIVGTDIDNANTSTAIVSTPTNINYVPNSTTSNVPLVVRASKTLNIVNKSHAISKNYSLVYKRLYDRLGPVMFPIPPLKGIKHPRGELKLWPTSHDRVISQNSSKRKVHRSLWIPPQNDYGTNNIDQSNKNTITAYPMALKFVEDGNARDGRSIKREIECHLYIYQRLSQLQQDQGYSNLEDAWPCAELIGYYLDKKNPGNSVLVTRKLSGPDFFDIIRSEHSSSANAIYSRCQALYEYNKLQWCTLALTRIAQYSALGIRHNDIKPDNIVLDFYYHHESSERHLDVKIIDLGTASMHSAKDFTGGTSWYESPEQKMLEYYTKKSRDLKSAKMVDIGLSSDSWGAGISIAEVLMGRRVVDSMKSPYGPGPLEFKGKDGWLIEPQEWIEFAKMALGFDNNSTPYKYKICEEAAKFVFNMLVQVNSNERANIKDVIQKMDYYTQKAYQEVKRKHQVN